jgi:hypothetical protein
MAHFARFASIYAQLYEYRAVLMQEASETGHPLIRLDFFSPCLCRFVCVVPSLFYDYCCVFEYLTYNQPNQTNQLTLLTPPATPYCRPMCLHYGYDKESWPLVEQYLVGTELLAAPVLYEGATSAEVYFPFFSGSWVHIVSQPVVFLLNCF